MSRFLVTTRRNLRTSAATALQAVTGQPGVTVVDSNDPHMVTIEATEQDAGSLREKLKGTHFVEPEFRRSLH